MTDNTASIETLSEFKGERDEVTRWLREIENSTEWERNWREEAELYHEIYKDQAKGDEVADKRYNIFWANTQVLRPLVYSKLPEASIKRRFLDDAPVARILSELMERSVNYFLQSEDADNVLIRNRDDYLIGGRGIARVIFDVEFLEIKKENEEEREDEETEEIDDENLEIDTKKVKIEYVDWQDFRIAPSKDWDSVRWIAFKHKMNRKELVEKFGSKGKDVQLESNILANLGEDKAEEIDHDIFKVAEVWEIWDKPTKKIIYMTPGLDGKLLSKEEDSYNLKGFFPTPRPLGSDSDPDSLLPIPLYRMYKSQAEELNSLDSRIKNLIEQIKFTGGYSSIASSEDVKSFFNGRDGELSPLKIQPGTSIKDAIYLKPIIEIANVVSQLNVQKTNVINNIRDITGLSDIVRGTSYASETATAQRIKGDFAISRIQPLQKDVARYARDLINLMAELIVENYDAEELAKITNLKIIDIEAIQKQAEERASILLQEGLSMIEPNDPQAQEKAQILQEQAQLGIKKALKPALTALNGYAVTPQELEVIDKTMKNDLLRDFAVDIETDSTISADLNQEKIDRAEWVSAITNYSSSIYPLVEAGIVTPTFFNQGMAFISKPFKVGRNLEEHLLATEEIDEEPEGPTIEEQIMQADNARKDQEIQLKAQEVDIKQQLADIKKAEIKQSQIQFEDKIEFEDANKAADRLAKSANEAANRQVKAFDAIARTERANEVIRGSFE